MFTSIRKKITSKNPLYYDLEPFIINHSNSGMEVKDEFWSKLFTPNSDLLNTLIKCMSEKSGQLAETLSFIIIESYKKSPTEEKAEFIINNCLEDASETTANFNDIDYDNPSIVLNVSTEGAQHRDRVKMAFKNYKELSIKKHQNNNHLIYTRPSNFMFKEISEFIKKEMLKSQIPIFINYLKENSGFTTTSHGLEIYEGAIRFIKKISAKYSFGIADSNLK